MPAASAGVFALLMAMVFEHCQGYPSGAFHADGRFRLRSFFNTGTVQPDDLDTLDSYDIPANADAMKALAEPGYIEITQQRGQRIFARLLPEGRALIERLRADQQVRER